MDMLENPNAIANILPVADPACFDQRWVLGAQVGRDTSTNFALSYDGELAIRTADNRFVVPKLGPGGVVKLIDVTCLTIAVDPYVFRIPVSIDSIRPGHILVRSDSPFSVIVVERRPELGRIRGIDPRSDEAVEMLIPDKSLDIPTVLVRVMSLFDGFEGFVDEDYDADRDEDDGGHRTFQGLLPYLLLSGQGGLAIGGTNLAWLALAFSKSRRFDPRLVLLLAAAGGTQTSSLTQALLIASLSGFGSRRRRDAKAEAAASTAAKPEKEPPAKPREK
jgi:hypothetical protein